MHKSIWIIVMLDNGRAKRRSWITKSLVPVLPFKIGIVYSNISVIYDTGFINPPREEGGPSSTLGWNFEQIVAITTWDPLRSVTCI